MRTVVWLVLVWVLYLHEDVSLSIRAARALLYRRCFCSSRWLVHLAICLSSSSFLIQFFTFYFVLPSPFLSNHQSIKATPRARKSTPCTSSQTVQLAAVLPIASPASTFLGLHNRRAQSARTRSIYTRVFATTTALTHLPSMPLGQVTSVVIVLPRICHAVQICMK